MQTVTTPEEQKRVTELEKMKRSLERQLQEMTRTVEEQRRQIAMARRDPLTGLRNRAGIADQINSLLKKECEGTFFMMDMDNFKSVNDTYGHVEGDRALIRFAQALRKQLCPGEIAARIGGDEFVMFIPSKSVRGAIRDRAMQIIRSVEKELVVPGRLVRVTVSMGIALAPADGVTFEMLYTNADTALYSVKSEGKNACRFYDETQRNRRKKTTSPKATMADIIAQIREKKMEGSFVVDYDSFEKIYRFMERNIGRENRQVQCVLFTVNEPQGAADSFALQRQMEYLEHAVVSSLRKGDVTTSYSACQMLALLMDVNDDNAEMVVDRILQRYENEAGEEAMQIDYEAQPLQPEEIIDHR